LLLHPIARVGFAPGDLFRRPWEKRRIRDCRG
jgi:hypothetical protein